MTFRNVDCCTSVAIPTHTACKRTIEEQEMFIAEIGGGLTTITAIRLDRSEASRLVVSHRTRGVDWKACLARPPAAAARLPAPASYAVHASASVINQGNRKESRRAAAHDVD